jgi:hypothetical protein
MLFELNIYVRMLYSLLTIITALIQSEIGRPIFGKCIELDFSPSELSYGFIRISVLVNETGNGKTGVGKVSPSFCKTANTWIGTWQCFTRFCERKKRVFRAAVSSRFESNRLLLQE